MGHTQMNKIKIFIYCQVNLGVWGRRKIILTMLKVFVVLHSFSFGIVFGEYMHV